MSQIGFYLSILAVGFAMSGAAASFYRLVTSESADFLPFSSSFAGNIVAILLSMFAGPFIIACKVRNGLKNEEMAGPLVALLLIICSIWSFYSGVAILYFTHVVIA